MTLDTSHGPITLGSMEFGVVVCFMDPLFGRVHGDIEFIFNFDKKKLPLFLVRR